MKPRSFSFLIAETRLPFNKYWTQSLWLQMGKHLAYIEVKFVNSICHSRINPHMSREAAQLAVKVHQKWSRPRLCINSLKAVLFPPSPLPTFLLTSLDIITFLSSAVTSQPHYHRHYISSHSGRAATSHQHTSATDMSLKVFPPGLHTLHLITTTHCT